MKDSATAVLATVLAWLAMQLVALVLLVVLKLAGVGLVATWSWWWVLVPLWGPWALVALGFVLWILANEYEK